ncbi:hypothetical protein CCR75_002094 [Bremia lactucae]|uniref:Uncharacterized protein n=1 Tax=Bremia lactucae TaxID=4779 RepID=A0A976FN21_BRELC|nr:hypothetical protein CCR75_002094 [Bremia lactucae]
MNSTGRWSQEEHASFLIAIKLFPHGPWRKIAAYINTRSIRQVQTHAQKYHEKVVRRMRGLHKGRRSSNRQEHRIDDDLLAACHVGETFGFVTLKPMPPLQRTPLRLNWMHPEDGYRQDVLVNTFCNDSSSNCHSTLPTLNESLDFLIQSFSLASNIHE